MRSGFVLSSDRAEPRQAVQSGLNVCRANGWRSSGSGGFDGTLGQVIDCAGQPARSLDEQFERLVLEGIGMDTDGTKPCADVVTGLCRLEPSEGQSKAEP